MIGCVYVITEGTSSRPVKVGVAANPLGRMSELQTGNHRRLRLARAWNMWTRDDAFQLEGRILESFKDRRLSGEWIDCTDQEIVDFVVSFDDEATAA